MTICPNAKTCGGCSLWEIPLQDQILQKRERLFKSVQSFTSGMTLENIQVFSVGPGQHRLWFDFQIRGNKMGLFPKRGLEIKDIVDLRECLLLSPKLQTLFDQIRTIVFPSFKISARIRISPSGLKGLWLDLANTDIKTLLEEKTTLLKLKEIFDVIEIGQKRKQLKFLDSLKLKDPETHAWFQTLTHPLMGHVGGFTQPSIISGDQLTQIVLSWSHGFQNISEFGSGIGQYTIPLLASGKNVEVFETNPLAIQALTLNAQSFQNHLRINPEKNLSDAELFLVNPPRSGLGIFVNQIIDKKPERVIYISCSVESLTKDLEQLKKYYVASSVKLIDQFPHSPHFESAVLLERVNI